MTPRGNAKGECPLLKVEKESTTTYVEAVNYMLKFFAKDEIIAKVNLKIASLKKVSNETPDQFPDVLRTKVVLCKTFILKNE